MLTEVNDIGEPISANKQEELLALVASLSKKSDVMVVSGSLPQGVDSGYYTKLFNVAAPGSLKIADAEGPRLLSALQAGLDLVKPNKDELQNTLQKELKTREDLLKGCYTLLDKGAKRVLLSLGKRGAIITDGTKTFSARASTSPSIRRWARGRYARRRNDAADGRRAARRDPARGSRRGHRDGHDFRTNFVHEE